jgi:ArsR family transcriptional regulator
MYKALMIKPPMDILTFQTKANEVANLLSLLGNPRRLMVLCKLTEHGEMTVRELADEVDLSQSALSQHLGKMRDEGLVTFRRESQTLWYRIADPRTETLLGTLYQLYCQKD